MKKKEGKNEKLKIISGRKQVKNRTRKRREQTSQAKSREIEMWILVKLIKEGRERKKLVKVNENYGSASKNYKVMKKRSLPG